MGAYICHHGIKGMRKGLRRYQNKDGSLTPAGVIRYRKMYGDRTITGPHVTKTPKQYTETKVDKKPAKKVASQNTKKGKDGSERGNNRTKMFKDISDLTRKASEKSKADIAAQRKHKPRMDLSDKTTAELRDAINREKAEREYNDFFAPDNISKGRINVDKFLERGAAIAGVVAVGVEVLDKIGFFDDTKKDRKKKK